MSKAKYAMLLVVATDNVETMTPNMVERFFLEVESAGCKLKSAKDWLLKQNLSEYTRGRVDGIYELFLEE